MSTNPTPSTLTEIAFILDRSGSMNRIREGAIAGFNQFLRDQQASEKEGEGLTRLTLIQFDDQYEVPIDNLPIGEVVELDTTTYVPRGSTALLDAIGKTIKSSRKRIMDLPKQDRPGQVIFAIFTDGLENSSLHYDWKDISKMIGKRREKNGWEFLFLAANQDAVATAAQMNIDRRNAGTSDFSSSGIRSSSRSFSRKIRAMKQSTAFAGSAPEDLDAPLSDILDEENKREKE